MQKKIFYLTKLDRINRQRKQIQTNSKSSVAWHGVDVLQKPDKETMGNTMENQVSGKKMDNACSKLRGNVTVHVQYPFLSSSSEARHAMVSHTQPDFLWVVDNFLN